MSEVAKKNKVQGILNVDLRSNTIQDSIFPTSLLTLFGISTNKQFASTVPTNWIVIKRAAIILA